MVIHIIFLRFRGVRQGCPETLANKIRNDKNVKDIKIDKKQGTKNKFAS